MDRCQRPDRFPYGSAATAATAPRNSPWHTRRARLILSETLNGRVTYAMRASRFDPFNWRDWWRSRQQAWYVVSEYEKLVYHYLVRVSERLRLI